MLTPLLRILLVVFSLAVVAAERPNVIFILTDDHRESRA